jgi:hypothetical protein
MCRASIKGVLKDIGVWCASRNCVTLLINCCWNCVDRSLHPPVHKWSNVSRLSQKWHCGLTQGWYFAFWWLVGSLSFEKLDVRTAMASCCLSKDLPVNVVYCCLRPLVPGV